MKLNYVIEFFFYGEFEVHYSWVVRSCLISSIEDCMVVLMATTLTLSCFTSCWVSVNVDCKVLKRASQSWLRYGP
jgi:hypothetical protein